MSKKDQIYPHRYLAGATNPAIEAGIGAKALRERNSVNTKRILASFLGGGDNHFVSVCARVRVLLLVLIYCRFVVAW